MQLKSEDLKKAREIKTFLETNYNRHYNYDDLVQLFNMNKFKLKLAFKEVAKGNVHEYVTKVRIEQAKLFLENSDKSIRHIASDVGLDRSNFNIQFKKITGKTPSEWRKNHGQVDHSRIGELE